MHLPEQTSIKNTLLKALHPNDFSTLRRHLEAVTLNVRDPLNEPNKPTRFVYFLETGIGSILAGPERTTGVEIGIVGREGLVGTSVLLGAEQTPHNCFIQVAGNGWRIPARELVALMESSASLRAVLMRYIHCYMVQVASTAHANADYALEERLARWILMCHDRADGDQVPVTHEFMALMLGVRRPGVTVTIHILEGEGMIKATRGVITVLDREKLKRRANGSYGLAEAEYERLFSGGSEQRSDASVIAFPTRTGV